MPSEFGAWQTVYHYFRTWQREGRWRHIHEQLRQQVRQQVGRHRHQSAGIVDSQSVKTGGLWQHAIGFDSGKRIKGRKRHLLVDTLGLLIVVLVTAANCSDQAGAKQLFQRARSLGMTR